jgi:MFS family permease
MDHEGVNPKFNVSPMHRLFVGIAVLMAWINIGWLIVGFAPLLPFISQELNIPVGTVMICVFPLSSLAGGIGIMLCGPLIDRYGPRKVLFVSTILCVIYNLLLPHFTHNMVEISVLRIITGLITQGPCFAGNSAMAQRWFPHKEQSTWIGIWQSGFAIGMAVMYVVYYPLMKYFDGEWRDVAAFTAVPSAVAFILLGITYFFGKEPAAVRHDEYAALVKRDFSIARLLPIFWICGILLGCAQGIMETINGLTASYLMSATQGGLNWLPFKAGPAMAFIQYGMVAGAFLMSTVLYFVFRGSLKWYGSFNFLLSGLFAYFLTMSYPKSSLLHMEIAFFIVGFFANQMFPIVTTFITQNFPPYILGRVFGVAGGISILLGAFFSGLAGMLLNWTDSYKSIYILILAIGVFACILIAVTLNPIKVFAKREAPVPQAAGGAK